MTLVLEVESLSVRYGHVEAVRNIDLSVDEGEIVSLVGANGAGKTSALLAISGFIPASGTLRLGGKTIHRWAPHRRVRAGLIQVAEGRAILGRMTIEENLALGGRHNRHAAATLKRIFHLFPVLEARRHSLAGLLSGGEQQMLAIGRALMAAPRILMLDEPSMGLAPLVVQEIFSALKEIHREGLSLLLVEQNVRQALLLANRGIVIESGQIALAGPAEELMHDPRMIEAYLGGAA